MNLKKIFKKVFSKIVTTILFFLTLSIVCFLIIKIAPGDPVKNLLGVNSGSATEEEYNELKESLGLNKPIYEQYVLWLEKAVKLDFGRSYMTQRPVTSELLRCIKPTALLASLAIIVMVLVSLPLGILAAIYKGSLFDRIVNGFCMMFTSVPTFWLGLLLIQLFSVNLRWLPTTGDIEKPISLILPSLTLGLNMSPQYIKLLRENLISSRNKDFIRSARAKGIPEGRIFFFHSLRDCLIPVVTVFGVSLGSLLGGTVITEAIFSLPGIGKLALDALTRGDYTVIQGYLMLLGFIVFIINNVLDITYRIINPEIALKEEKNR